VEDAHEMLFGNKEKTFKSKEFKITSMQLSGYIYGQINSHDEGWMNPSYTQGIIELLTRVVSGNDKTDEMYCNKYENLYGDHCSIECPLFNACPDCRNVSKQEERSRRNIKDLNQLCEAASMAKTFYESTPGYEYYYITCGCQTSMTRYMSNHYEEVFKNIKHFYLGEL
jgi:hypothetical protein